MNVADEGEDRRTDAREGLLLDKLRAGDEGAFETVVREHWPRLMAVARRFLPIEQDAQDVVQDAFLSAFRGLDRFQGQSSLGTWLHRIVVNSALMKLRSRQRKPERPIDDYLPSFSEDGHLADPADTWGVSLDTVAGQRETQEVVRGSIEQLPESYRTVLLLRDIEERSTEETAGLLDISVGAVKTRLHRARQALRTLLDPYMTGKA